MTREEILKNRADLSGANLSRANLFGADLSGANLSRANLFGADLSGADLSGASLSRADLTGAILSGADLSGADLSGANLSRANLIGANLYEAILFGLPIRTMKVFSGLYAYQVHVVHFQNDTFWIRMGCLFKSLEEWKTIGILNSNLFEFPNDGSEKSLERERAFNFALETAKAMGATL